MPRRRTHDRAGQERIYNLRVKVWLRDELCAVAEAGLLDSTADTPATQCHHRAGRDGEFLLMEKFWLPVCQAGHDWIENNRDEAKKRGWLLNRSRKALEAQGLL